MLRVLARENRLYRRFLGENLTEVLLGGNVRARMVQSLSGVVYVFMAVGRTMDFQHRIAELTARCLVARSRHPNAGTVVGIASERADDGERGLSFGLCLIDKPEWTVEDEKEANWLSESLGYFWSPIISTRHIEEYPIGTMDPVRSRSSGMKGWPGMRCRKASQVRYAAGPVFVARPLWERGCGGRS